MKAILVSLIVALIPSVGHDAEPHPLVDLSFLPAENVAGNSYGPAVVQSDGKILLGMGSETRRMNADGSLDQNFLPIRGSGPTLVTAGGEIYVAAQVVTWPELGQLNRADARGNIRWSVPHGLESIRGAFLHTNGHVVIFGRGGMKRFSPNGTQDDNFAPLFPIGMSFTPEVWAAVSLSNGKILASVYFSELQSSGSRLVRLNEDGSQDGTFSVVQLDYSSGRSLISLPDGKILVGGGSSPSPGVVRLFSDGTPDPDFQAPSYSAQSMVRQPDGKIIIGGGFLGDPVNLRAFPALLTRLNSDGSFDKSFGCPLCDYENEDGQSVQGLTLDGAGNVIATGHFFVPGTPLYGVVRLKSAPPIPTMQFVQPKQAVNENTGLAVVKVVRDGNTDVASSIAYVTYGGGGNAIPWKDYFPRLGILIFGIGETEKFLRVPIIRDKRRESTESFAVLLFAPSPNSKMGQQRKTQISIIDASQPAPPNKSATREGRVGS